MDKELFNFLLKEENYTLEELHKVYEWDNTGTEIANKITDIVNNKPSNICDIAIEGKCSRCPIKRIKYRLPEGVDLSCVDIYIIINLLKEDK